MDKPNPSEDFLRGIGYKAPPGYPPVLTCDPEQHTMAGVIGGAMVGLMTGFFHPSRIVTPVSPFPPTSPKHFHEGTKILVSTSAVGWRVCKRMFVGSILFPFLVCQFQGTKKKPSVLDCALAGAMAGAIFGFRGGAVGIVNGCLSFAVFGGLTEITRRVMKN